MRVLPRLPHSSGATLRLIPAHYFVARDDFFLPSLPPSFLLSFHLSSHQSTAIPSIPSPHPVVSGLFEKHQSNPISCLTSPRANLNMMFSKSAVAAFAVALFATSVTAQVGANSTIDASTVLLNTRGMCSLVLGRFSYPDNLTVF